MNTPRPTLILPVRRAFTLVEVLASMAILSFILLALVQVTNATQKTYTTTVGRVEQFRDARQAFEAMTRRLSQATLNTYWDYYPPLTSSTTAIPSAYVRQSELRFVSGSTQTLLPDPTNRPTQAIFFQAPLGVVSDTRDYHGLDSLLNTWGYCIEFGSDANSRPPFLASLARPPATRYRFRLVELQEPSDSFSLYLKEAALSNNNTTPPTVGNALYYTTTWFCDPAKSSLPLGQVDAINRPVHVLADNIVALILLPKLSKEDQNSTQNASGSTGSYTDSSLSPYYLYDSTSTSNNSTTLHNTSTTDPALNPRNQIPPIVQVTMVAVDEASYNRSQGTQNTAPTLFNSSLFGPSAQSSAYMTDLQTLENSLQTNRLTYRVFTTDVSIKAAKWSRNQTN